MGLFKVGDSVRRLIDGKPFGPIMEVIETVMDRWYSCQWVWEGVLRTATIAEVELEAS